MKHIFDIFKLGYFCVDIGLMNKDTLCVLFRCVLYIRFGSVSAVDIYVNLWFICQRINMIDMHHWWNT